MILDRVTIRLALVSLLLSAACGSSTSPPDAGSVDAAAGDGPAQEAGPSCPAPSSGPTTHAAANLTGTETWSAAGSPHLVTGTIFIRDGGKLTIEPCAEVRLAADASIKVAQPLIPNMGELTAMGTAERPITFLGMSGARWGNIHLVTPGKVRLAHVTLRGGGAEEGLDGATVVAEGNRTTPAAADLFLDHVTISGSLGAGLRMTDAATFATGSTQLTVEGSGGDMFPWPVRIDPQAIDALPDGLYTGNRKDEILIVDEGVNMSRGLQADATLHDRGVPYHVRTVDMTGLRVGSSVMGDPTVTLTIEPGVTMKFDKQGALEMEHFTGTHPATGVLRAIGTEAKPIVFTSGAATPAPGDWRGLFYGGVISPMNRLDHARVEYAGDDCLCGHATCSDIARHEAAVILSSAPPSAFITNSAFTSSKLHAILRGYEYEGSTFDFRPTNTFTDNGGCPQTLPVRKGETCPNPKPACD